MTTDERDDVTGAEVTGVEPAPGAAQPGDALAGDAPATDDPLLVRVREIATLPVAERAAAFESVNRALASALGELEQL